MSQSQLKSLIILANVGNHQVALYEDIDQPKPRTKKKPAVQPTKAEVTSQPELARYEEFIVFPLKLQASKETTSLSNIIELK